ncbi:polyprenyl synthetase family protein [uncultured Amnibacterium sp.]|uniref:polyprenyl synthetase family protein n=1 Tax=uncultured Amnibacterium sp. TaxID=1631851 RepID=UPI0035CAD236
MSTGGRLVDLVQDRLDGFLDARSPILAAIADDTAPMESISRDFLRFGKRFRARFCYWGWQAVQAADDWGVPFDDEGSHDLPAVIGASAALELFHAAALVHDDLIDASDTRRGAPAAHRAFEGLHRDREFVGDAARFGRSAAVLLGDLLLVWSDELFAESIDTLRDRENARAARGEYNRMRTDVTAGQYLDIVAEAKWPHVPGALEVDHALNVITYKSAKYSIEAPLAIGASLGGASLAQMAALREFGLPLGVAFQLRDDLLGVFGDSDVTGKPAGDDLVEGKRTVLIALARRALPASARRTLDELLGDPDLTDEQVLTLQETIRASGAIDATESLIAENVERALDAIADAPLTSDARDALAGLADSISVRTA